jgi:hypothetical protein
VGFSVRTGAIGDEEIAQIPAIPSPTVLADLKMRETPVRVFGLKGD